MSTISSINNAPAGYVATIDADTSTTAASSFSQALAVAQTPKSWLTTTHASLAQRPSIKEFTDLTGADFLDASELIYGVIGSNTDVRDWSAIMANNDPITAARQATNQMYGRTDMPQRTDASYMKASDMVAIEGNFAVRLPKDPNEQADQHGLKLIDAQGLLLRDAGTTPKTIARNAWLFGFDTQPLAKLAQAVDNVYSDLAQVFHQASAITPTAQQAATNAAPVAKVQTDDQATSPSLEQLLQEAATQAYSYPDTSTYLKSLFKA
jgi:hypothetical protein